jgi:hypothetical protein
VQEAKDPADMAADSAAAHKAGECRLVILDVARTGCLPRPVPFAAIGTDGRGHEGRLAGLLRIFSGTLLRHFPSLEKKPS